MNANWYHWEGQTLILRVRVQPRAAKDEFAGCHGDRLKIRITAPPVEGKANAHLIQFLAKEFDVPKSRVNLVAGAGDRDKRLQIENPRKLPIAVQPAP